MPPFSVVSIGFATRWLFNDTVEKMANEMVVYRKKFKFGDEIL